MPSEKSSDASVAIMGQASAIEEVPAPATMQPGSSAIVKEAELEVRIKDIIHTRSLSEAIYYLTEQDKRNPHFMAALTAALDTLGFRASCIEHVGAGDSLVSTAHSPGHGATAMPCCPSVLMLRKDSRADFIEVRIAVIGNVDAGKSTLLGVLTRGSLDDGRGKARIGLFRHKHELESGRTSSVGSEILGFNAEGRRVETSDARGKKMSSNDICESSAKIVSFMDLAGHEKYLKTTMFGLTGYAPDYAMLMVGSNAGLVGMAKEHLALTFALSVPMLIVITKIDMTPPNVADENLRHLVKLLKSPSCQRTPIVVRHSGEILAMMKSFLCERYCPIFQVSNVTGVGMPLLLQFLSLIPARAPPVAQNPLESLYVEYQITETYDVHGVGTVVCGTLMCGNVLPGQVLFLGPDSSGAFLSTQIKSIQRKKLNVDAAYPGQCVTLALKRIKRAQIKKGMVLVSREPPGLPQPSGAKSSAASSLSALPASPFSLAVVYEFAAEVLILFHATTITLKYQAMLHCGVIRQTVSIVALEEIVRANRTSCLLSARPGAEQDGDEKPHPARGQTRQGEILRTGDRAVVRFRFTRKPEYLKTGLKLLLREGRTKGVGKVVALYLSV